MTADPEQRWIEARRLLADADRRTPRRPPGRHVPPAWSVGAAVVLGALAVAIATVVLAGSGSAVPRWREAAGLAVTGLGFAVAAGAGVWMWRSGQRGGRPPIAVLTRQQRRLLRDQVLGRAPVDAVRLPLARYRAMQLSQQAPFLLMLAALSLLEDGQTLGGSSGSQVILTVGLAALFTVGAVVLTRQIDQAATFLRRHPEPVGAIPGAPGSFLDHPDGAGDVV